MKTPPPSELVAEWPLPPLASLGSTVRAIGIQRELRRHLPWKMRSFLRVDGNQAVLHLPIEEKEAFSAASAKIATAIEEISAYPVLPSEVEDILGISSRERHKWMKQSRLKSAGTRTVKMRGRAKAVTFHVFDAQHIEDILDRDLPTIWRQEDAAMSAENRKRAAAKRRQTRTQARSQSGCAGSADDASGSKLEGWDVFAAEGLLRAPRK